MCNHTLYLQRVALTNQYPSFIGVGLLFVCLLYMWGKNISLGFQNSPNTITADIWKFPPAMGSQTHSLESIGTLMCVRSTMKRRSQTTRMIISVMTVGGLTFIINGLMFYFSFFSPKTLPFLYYRTDDVVKVLEILFYLLTPTAIIINQLSNLCMLEEIAIVKNALKSEDDEEDFDITRLYLFRLAVVVISITPLLFGRYSNNRRYQ